MMKKQLRAVRSVGSAFVVSMLAALISCASCESPKGPGNSSNQGGPLAAGVPAKVEASDVDSGGDVVVQVEMQGWSTGGGNVKVEWEDESYLASPVTRHVAANAAKFSFKQPTKSNIGNQDRPNKVTVSTTSSKSDGFTIKHH